MGKPSRKTDRRTRHLRVEPLEPRQMLSGAGNPASEAYATDIHEYLAEEAGDLYGALFGVSGIDLEYEAYMAGTIRVAVVEEDNGTNWTTHFCEGGDGSELTDGILWYGSAYTKANDTTYPDAVNYYNSGSITDAYYWLGRTMHLLQDMAVPAHVHNDQHAIGTDEYEDNVGNYTGYYSFAQGDYWNFQNWVGDWSSAASLWDRSDDYGSLEALFRETTDYTDDYDSDDYPGDWHNSTTGGYFSLARLDALDRAYHATWADQYVTGDGSELNSTEVQYLARDLGTWAVEQGAMLLRYSLDDLGKVVAAPAGIHVDDVAAVGIQVDWDAVVGADGYVVFRSTSPDAGFAYVGTTSSSYHSDSGLLTGTTYYYRVYAYNGVAGLGSGYASVSALTDQLPGDANRDGAVNQADAAILAQNWGKLAMNWEGGDFKGDGQVNAADASILAANWGIVPAPLCGEGSSEPDIATTPTTRLVGPMPASEPGARRRVIEPAWFSDRLPRAVMSSAAQGNARESARSTTAHDAAIMEEYGSQIEPIDPARAWLVGSRASARQPVHPVKRHSALETALAVDPLLAERR